MNSNGGEPDQSLNSTRIHSVLVLRETDHTQYMIMSNSTRQLNNQNPAPDVPVTASVYPKDPDFYFKDGNTVFLVGGVLFRFQASLLIPNDRKDRLVVSFATNIKGCSESPIHLDLSNISTSRLGLSDNRPFHVPNLKLPEFRVLLTALLGRPGSEPYMSLLTDAQSKQKHSKELLLRYLDLTMAARRFGLVELSSWGTKQLALVLQSATQLAAARWNEAEMETMWAANYPVPSRIGERLFAFCLLVLSRSLGLPPLLESQPNKNIDTCAALYQNCSTMSAPYANAIASATLPFMLSLGPRSSTWKTQTSQDARTKLYLAYAHLISLGNISQSQLNLAWIEDPEANDMFTTACDTCKERLPAAWGDTFGQVDHFDSPVPLVDIRKLAALPQYRQQLLELGQSWSCPMQCIQGVIWWIDPKLKDLFTIEILAAYRSVTK